MFFPLVLTLPSELALIKGPGRLSPTFSLPSPEPHTGPHVSLRLKAHSERSALLCNMTTCCRFAFMLCLRSPYMHKSTAEKRLWPGTNMLRVYRVFVHLVLTCPLKTHAHCLAHAGPFLYKQEQAVSLLLLFPCFLQPSCPPVILDRNTSETINHKVI